MTPFPNYTIQEWLFDYAHGKIDIDLAESGIEPLDFSDVYDGEDINLNYVRDQGTESLIEQIASRYGVNEDQVVVTNGGQEALFLFYTSVLDKGDEVITFSPGWQQSWVVPGQLGCKVHQLQRIKQDGWMLPLEEIKEKVSDKTAAIIVNSPQNPTGQILGKEEIDVLATLADKHSVFIVIDEEYVTDYNNSLFHKIPNSFSVSSLSKVCGLPGLRVGWIVGEDREVLDNIVNAKRYTTVCNSAISEHIATKTLNDYQWYVDRYNAMTNTGREILESWIENKNRLRLYPSQSTPYTYVSFNDGTNSNNFCKKLIDEKGVLLMPAEVFGDTEGFRITFARHESLLRKGLSFIDELL